jgi:monofunctional biosynthetic peptidoglycan transglycosylase
MGYGRRAMYQPDYRPRKRLSVAYDILRLPRLARPLRAVLFAVLALLLLPYALTLLYAAVNPVSTVMLWRRISGDRVQYQYIPLARMAPALPLAVIIGEDGRFCSHHGVDFRGIRAAIAVADDLDDLRGASTLTQQVAKNLFLWPGRSYVRKALELPLALWIDLVLPKRRVLEIYLNIAEWGPNGEFGVEAGSRRAFGKSARDLTPGEAAMLSAVLPGPAIRDARVPGPVLRRLAGLYVARAARSPDAAACVRRGP